MTTQPQLKANAVSYLIFYIFAALFVFGVSYAVLSDIKDAVAIPIWDTLSPMGADLNDSESLWGFDFINMLISLSVTFFVIALIWFAKKAAQNPTSPWG